MSAGSHRRFLSSSESSELYQDSKLGNEGESKEHSDRRSEKDLGQKQHLEEKMPSKTKRTKHHVSNTKGNSSRKVLSVASQESLDILQNEIYERDETPYLELQEIAIPEEEEEAIEETQPRKSRLSTEDILELRSLQRLPVTSAYTFSFYDLPQQHRKYNEKINRSAKSLGSKRRVSRRKHSIT